MGRGGAMGRDSSGSWRTIGWGAAIGVIAYAAYRGAAAAFRPRSPDIALAAGLWLVHKPRRVLALASVPGELELLAGGTLALLSAGDSRVCVAVASEGGGDRSLRNLGQIRRREQESSAAVLGYNRLLWLDEKAGDNGPSEPAEHELALQKRLEGLIGDEEPDVLLAPDPRGTAPGAGGPLRAALGHAVLSLARLSLVKERTVLLYGTREPNVLVDITEVLQEKQTAVKCHRSHLAGPDSLSDRAVKKLGRLGQERLPSMYVEGFYRLV